MGAVDGREREEGHLEGRMSSLLLQAGEGREEKGEAPGGVGSAGLAQEGRGTVQARARAPR